MERLSQYCREMETNNEGKESLDSGEMVEDTVRM